MDIRVAHLILLEFTNQPACAAKDASRHLLMGQPIPLEWGHNEAKSLSTVGDTP
jgi:hypothetical protein